MAKQILWLQIPFTK